MGDSLKVSKRNSQPTIEKKNLILYGSNAIKDDECMGGMMGKLEVILFQTHCMHSQFKITHTRPYTCVCWVYFKRLLLHPKNK